MRARLFAVLAVASALGFVAFAAPQQPAEQKRPQTPGAISGVVTDASTGRPLANATVYLGPPKDGGDYKRIEITDSKGRFVFVGVPPGADYFVQASKPGYLISQYGKSGQGQLGGTVALAPGQWLKSIDISLVKLGGISGTITDEHGEPVPGVTVRVFGRLMVAGATHLSLAGVTRTDDRGAYRFGGLRPSSYIINVPSVQSTIPASFDDARGFGPDSASVRFSEAGDGTRLAVGQYATSPPTGSSLVYPPVFFGGTRSADEATRVDLAAGEERTGIDVRLELAPTVRISGRLDGPPASVAGQIVRLMAEGTEELGYGSEVATAASNQDGAFTLVNVPAGRYVLLVSRSVSEFDQRVDLSNLANLREPSPATPGLVKTGMQGGGSPGITTIFSNVNLTSASTLLQATTDSHIGRQSLTVGNVDITNVVVQLQRRPTIAGVIVWEGPQPPDSQWGPTTVKAEPASGTASHPEVQVQASFDNNVESFLINALSPTGIVLRVRNSRVPGVMKSIQWHGREWLDSVIDVPAETDLTGVVVTMTTDPPMLSGRVRDGNTGADANTFVVVFPTDRSLWRRYGMTPLRIATAPVSASGEYSLKTLPAGDYDLVAVSASQLANWQDPAWLELASGLARRVTLRWGELTTQDLTVTSIK